MKKRKILILIVIFILLGLFLRSLFIVDFRFFKEKKLIQRNYFKNIEHFKAIKGDFINYPTIF